MAYRPWLCHVTGSVILTSLKDGTGGFGEVSLWVGMGRMLTELGNRLDYLGFADLSFTPSFLRGYV